MSKEPRFQKRDKSAPSKPATDKAPKATQEQMMIAKLVDNENDDSLVSKNIQQIMEVTGVNEEQATLALYDSNDDPARAIELVLEKQTDNGWETAGRKKNRGGNSVTRGSDITNTDNKNEAGDRNRSDRGGGGGSGRGGRRSKGRTHDQNKSHDDVSNKENDHTYSKERRPGRGRSRGGMGRGRGRGSAPRHSRNRQPGGKSDGGNIFQSDTADSLQEPVEVWENPKPSVKCWDIEVGTWSSKEAQKHKEPEAKQETDVFQSNWSSENWADADLSESRVFQSQNQITVKPEVTSVQTIPTSGETYTGHDQLSNPIPKSGDRIDLGMLFKKMDAGMGNTPMRNSSNYSGLVDMSAGKTEPRNETDSSDGVQGIQQHCQVNYKDSNISSSSVTSRLFGEYDQSQKSIFQSEQTPNMLKNAFPQLNGSSNLHGQTKENSFLESFSGLHSSGSTKVSQSDLLGQLSLGNVPPQLQSYSQMRMPLGKTNHADSATLENFTKSRDENLLSFGSPLPPQLSQQTRQHRKATLPPKMPTSAVEMPLNKGCSPQDYGQFSLQFGADDQSAMADMSKHDYDVNIPRSTPSNVIPQRGGIFLNNENSAKTSVSHSSGNVDSLFSSSMQMPPNAEHKVDDMTGGNTVANVDHSIKVPPGLNMSVTTNSSFIPLTSSEGGQTNFLSRKLANDDGPGKMQESTHHGPNNYSQDVSSYYATSNSNQNPKPRSGVSSTGQPSISPVTQSGHNQESMAASNNLETSSSHSAALSSLTTGLSQVSVSQSLQTSKNTSVVSTQSMAPSHSYTSTVSTSDSQPPTGSSSVPINRKSGYSTVHDKTAANAYDSNSSGSVQSNLSSDMSPMVLGMQQQSQGIHSENSAVQNNSGYKTQVATTSPSTLGGFGSAKMAPAVSNKGNPSVPSGVTTPIQYGIPMPGLMPYTPDMQYGYDQLLLAQSRVVNPLNFYDVHFHGNAQTPDGQDSSVPVQQNLAGHSKFNRSDGSSSTPPTQIGLQGGGSTELSQHNSTVPMQAIPHKVTQSSTHHTGQQPYVGAMPAYPNYGNLAAPYYSLGMANAGFQYPATMFAAAAMHQPKHAVSSADSFPQSTRFNHTSTSMTSSSGLSDLSRSSFQKTHPSGMDKQGYHQHTNNPASFNLQTITAAVAAGGGTANGNAAPGLNPYGAPPYMALLQPHQQQAMHLLQHQHQDPTSGHSVGSQRNMGANGMMKSTKRGGYGTSNSYWGN